MKDRLEPFYQSIRTKLAQALQNWQPSDSSAEAVLLPWHKVFQQGTWDAFMNKHIVPKLVTLMQQFIIDPRQQNLGRVDKRLDENLYLSEEYLDPWNWFISWYEMVAIIKYDCNLRKNILS